MSKLSGRRTSYTNHIVHSGDKGIKDNAEKYNTGKLGRQAIGHTFNLIGAHSYKGITEQEIELRESYAKSLVANFEDVSTYDIILTPLDYSYSISRRTETFKVNVRNKGWGKVIINTTTIGDHNSLQFTLFKKATAGSGRKLYKDTRKKRKWHG